MKKIIISFSFVLLLSVKSFSQVPQITFDPTNWYTAIDSLYGIYDQIKTSVEQLKLQYESIQQAAEAVKSWNLDEIKWDGDFDIRNELRGFTSSINRQLSNIRSLEQSLTSKNIRIGDEGFSIADLVGAGEKNKTILDFADQTGKWANTKKLDKIKKAFEGRLTEDEKMAIMRKYGISAGNYMMVKHASDQVRSQVGRIIARNSEVGSEAWLKATEMQYGPIFKKAMGEHASPKQVEQAILMHQQLIAENLNLLGTNFLEVGEMIAWDMQKKQLEKEAKESKRFMIKAGRESRIGVSAMFLGGNSLKDR